MIDKMIPEELKNQIEKEAVKYPEKRGALLPALHMIHEKFGWLSPEIMEEVADIFSINPIEVLETVSFYDMFNLKPVGKHHLRVCTNISCSLLNSRHIVRYLEEKLNIKIGETQKNRKFSLAAVECLGYCGEAPVMMVNNELFENLTEEKIDQLINKLD